MIFGVAQWNTSDDNFGFQHANRFVFSILMASVICVHLVNLYTIVKHTPAPHGIINQRESCPNQLHATALLADMSIVVPTESVVLNATSVGPILSLYSFWVHTAAMSTFLGRHCAFGSTSVPTSMGWVESDLHVVVSWLPCVRCRLPFLGMVVTTHMYIFQDFANLCLGGFHLSSGGRGWHPMLWPIKKNSNL